MKQGALIFDETTDRYDIRFDLADYYGGLHCGDCFDVMIGGKWKPTRIEMNMEPVSYTHLIIYRGYTRPHRAVLNKYTPYFPQNPRSWRPP